MISIFDTVPNALNFMINTFGTKTASQMHIAPRIVIHCSPLLSIVVHCCSLLHMHTLAHWCPFLSIVAPLLPKATQLMPQTYLLVSYLIFSKRLLFKNIAHDGPGCTWLYLTVPGCTWMKLTLPWSFMIYLSTECLILPLTGLSAFFYTGLNAQKL